MPKLFRVPVVTYYTGDVHDVLVNPAEVNNVWRTWVNVQTEATKNKNVSAEFERKDCTAFFSGKTMYETYLPISELMRILGIAIVETPINV